MTSIDLTAAKDEAARRWPSKNIRDPLPSDWLNEGMASGFVLGAQWALAQVEARVKPTREEIIAAIRRCNYPDGPIINSISMRVAEVSADAVLALWPRQKTEQEVRAEFAREHGIGDHTSRPLYDAQREIERLQGLVLHLRLRERDLEGQIARGGERG